VALALLAVGAEGWSPEQPQSGEESWDTPSSKKRSVTHGKRRQRSPMLVKGHDPEASRSSVRARDQSESGFFARP